MTRTVEKLSTKNMNTSSYQWVSLLIGEYVYLFRYNWGNLYFVVCDLGSEDQALNRKKVAFGIEFGMEHFVK